MRVFTRHESGLLRGIEAHRMGDGWSVNGLKTDLSPTGRTETLIGWGDSDGQAVICATDSGVEVIVPERSAHLLQSRKANPLDYLAPAYRNDPDAADFANTIAERVEFGPADLWGSYVWDAPIPNREQWEAEIEALIEHVRSL